MATLACFPAMAEDVAFEGRTLEVEAGQDTRNILRIVGPRYQVNGTAGQIMDKARGCLASRQGVSVEAAEATSGQLVAISRTNYRALWSTYSVRSRLAIEAGDGHFRIVQSDLGVAQASSADAGDNDYALLQQQGAGWDNAVSAVIAVEQELIDCVYR